jgi:alpha-galactosidase
MIRHGSLSLPSVAVALLLLTRSSDAIDNGLGVRPPLGWRSWNAYHKEISQDKMTIAANAMVNKSRGISLLEAGYEQIGLDDYYQACGTGVNGSFHDMSGYPLINKTKFPDMKAMTAHAHSLGLKIGWYGNNWYVTPYMYSITGPVDVSGGCVDVSGAGLVCVFTLAFVVAVKNIRMCRRGDYLHHRGESPMAYATTRETSKPRST